MSNAETHYINYDPDQIWKLITYSHIANGGDLLYPGDEKEILLRTVLALMVQGFAIVDNALMMDSLQHTADEFMDIYGSKRGCYRMEAQPAEAVVEMVFPANMLTGVIPAGTAMTADGQRIYKTAHDVVQTGYAQVSTVRIVAETAGAAGNGLPEGTQMRLCTPNPSVTSVTVVTPASGGRDQESDESYRERIREYGLVSITTGPRQMYEQVAKAVSPDVLDARAVQTAPCTVCVYLTLADEADRDALISAVLTALSDETQRPLTDLVHVQEAENVPYVLNVRCTVDEPLASETLANVVSEYQAWQDDEIQRPFNPDRLMALLYQAGVSRVQWDDGSNFNGGTVEYTAIESHQRCKGTVSLNVVS